MLYALGILADLVKASVYFNIGPGVHLNPEFIQEALIMSIYSSLFLIASFLILIHGTNVSVN